MKYRKEQVEFAIKGSKTKTEAIKKLGLKPNGGNFRYFNTILSYYDLQFNKKYNYEIELKKIINVIQNSYSIREVALKLGLINDDRNKTSSSIYKWFYNITKKNNISYSHFTGKRWNKGKTKFTNKKVKRNGINNRKYSDDKVFCEKSLYRNSIGLKNRILDLGREYKCSICHIKQWQRKRITLHIDHINGVNNDNRIENLRFLCPNCHQQTHNWGAKNLKC